jgi:hypothetical protein
MTRQASGGAISQRALNRAILARQFLLARQGASALETIRHLGGIQAQAPRSPHVGLWTRLTDYRTEELDDVLVSRAAVRGTFMRVTLHLVTTDDCRYFRALLQPMIERVFASTQFWREIKGIDLTALLKDGRDLIEGQPLTRAQLGPMLAQRWPGYDPTSLAYAVSYLLPTVQPPPRGLWQLNGPAVVTTVEHWLDAELACEPSPDELVLRYLGAFGPASVRDAQVWSGLTRLGEVFERLRPRLVTFTDSAGRELFDLPDAPRPDEDVEAAVRYLPEFDNLLLSHDDRSRVNPVGLPPPIPPGNGGTSGTVLVDGFWLADWKLSQDDGAAIVTVTAHERLTRTDKAEVRAEGHRLLAFLAPCAERTDVRV